MTEDKKDQERLDRLAAYEDTGLEPEDIDALQKREQGLAEMLVQVSCGCAVSYTRLAELAKAEKDGRLVVLPYKIGDLVYQIAVRRKYLNHSMSTPYIKAIEIKAENAHKYIDEIGKTVFLTREEAETALKKREEADNEAN